MTTFRWPAAILLLVGCAGTTQALAQDAPPTPEKIRQWIKELQSDQFRTREAASRHLRSAGSAALQPLANAAAGPNLEVTVRAMSILDSACRSSDADLAGAARALVFGLLASENDAAAGRAKAILARERNEVIAVLQKAGVGILRTDAAVTGLVFDNDKEVAKHVGLLRHLPDIDNLSLSNRAFGDAQVVPLKHLQRLAEMNLFQSSIGDDALKHFKHFPMLRRIPMGHTKVTDAGLEHLKDLTNLEYVGLRGNQVTDGGLVHLKGLINLTGLHLGETKITDAGLAHLKNLGQLHTLYLGKTAITDRGLEHLHGLGRLHYVDVTETKVTEAGIAKLRDRIAGLRIDHSVKPNR